MTTCTCGNPVAYNSKLCLRCTALRILDLDADATEKEIKAAYHILVKVWHPDRFQSDDALKVAAEAKLKRINLAYMLLSPTSRQGTQWQQPRRGPIPTPPQAWTPSQGPSARRPQPGKAVPVASPARKFSRWNIPLLKVLFKLGILALAILLGRYLWIAFGVQDATTDDLVRTIQSFSRDGLLRGLEASKARLLDAIESDLRRLDPRSTTATPLALPQTPKTASPLTQQAMQTARQNAARRRRAAPPPPPRQIYSFITVGSTKDEVLEQEGTPTASSENKLVYGRSELYFKNNSVIGWKIDPVSSPIWVKLWPDFPVDTSLTFFTIGDSKDVVLVVQGTPTAFSKDKFEYGRSEVYFQNNRVVRWKSDPASIPLRARLE